MNKAEEWLKNKLDEQEYTYDLSRRYKNCFPDEKFVEWMQLYADEQSRDRAIRYADAFHNCMSDRDVTGLTAFEVYDRWWNKVKPPI